MLETGRRRKSFTPARTAPKTSALSEISAACISGKIAPASAVSGETVAISSANTLTPRKSAPISTIANCGPAIAHRLDRLPQVRRRIGPTPDIAKAIPMRPPFRSASLGSFERTTRLMFMATSELKRRGLLAIKEEKGD